MRAEARLCITTQPSTRIQKTITETIHSAARRRTLRHQHATNTCWEITLAYPAPSLLFVCSQASTSVFSRHSYSAEAMSKQCTTPASFLTLLSCRYRLPYTANKCFNGMVIFFYLFSCTALFPPLIATLLRYATSLRMCLFPCTVFLKGSLPSTYCSTLLDDS